MRKVSTKLLVAWMMLGGMLLAACAMVGNGATFDQLGKNRYNIWADEQRTFDSKAKELCPGGYKVLKTSVPPKSGSTSVRISGTVECEYWSGN